MLTSFHLPRFREIPNVGLYLEQLVKYMNECLEPLHITVTPTMISNYVKKGYIRRPNKKQYDADQIAYLFFLVIAKRVLSMEHIEALFKLQEASFGVEEAYNCFCEELEEILEKIFAKEGEIISLVEKMAPEKRTLTSVVIAIAHVIYLEDYFENAL